MALNDADVADLAREAVDRSDPTLQVRIEPAAQDDPYRLGAGAWTVFAGGRRSYVTASMTWREALDKLVHDLSA